MPSPFVCHFILHFSQRASPPLHKLSSPPHLFAAVGDAAVAHEAQTPVFTSPELPCQQVTPFGAVLECAIASLMVNTAQVGIVPLMALAAKHSSADAE